MLAEKGKQEAFASFVVGDLVVISRTRHVSSHLPGCVGIVVSVSYLGTGTAVHVLIDGKRYGFGDEALTALRLVAREGWDV
jgi:hypothetical protein